MATLNHFKMVFQKIKTSLTHNNQKCLVHNNTDVKIEKCFSLLKLEFVSFQKKKKQRVRIRVSLRVSHINVFFKKILLAIF